ncbi:hypothetical protein BSL78_21141 [Apostichopus japonicus]|uniref:RRM domain-containing protein n=1 Tax=Stichopus japonicus TaxID=307972 RepID=A0A2G8K230_STIJA|nr:hypothetical protein BSL78_21141 [Apostichopus japonicus]
MKSQRKNTKTQKGVVNEKWRAAESRKVESSGEQGVLKCKLEGFTVTPYERSVWVTLIHVGLEVRQELVATVLGRFGAVKAIKMCSYAQAPGVFNGHRQVRIDLKQDIPSFLLLPGIKLTCVTPVSPVPASGVGRPGTKPRAAQTKSVGAAFVLGMIPLLAQAKLCAHSVGRRDMFFALVPPMSL